MGLLKPISNFPNTTTPRLTRVASTKYFTVRMSSSTTTAANSSSKSTKKAGKQGIKETLLTPRFYTTDFDEMETLFNTEINKNLNQNEFEALLQEFKTDYNQTHFVRNKEFKEAADKIQGPLRNIFVEFLERSCTAEFSGFLLYKELGRRLKVYSNLKMDFKFFFPLNSKFQFPLMLIQLSMQKTNPVVAEIFSLMSRDEARHAGYYSVSLSLLSLFLCP